MAAESTIVLASSSTIRRELLERAGLTVIVDPARVDEATIKEAMRADGAKVEEVAEALADTKGRRVMPRHPGRLVVAADQMLECGNAWFDKPPDMDHARAQLRALRGKTHRLVSCVVAMRDGGRTWHTVDSVEMTMRPFSDAFLEDYLDRMGESVLDTVGGYRLEGEGVQLFTAVRGDFFSVLGLPLLPLLDHLRAQRLLPE